MPLGLALLALPASAAPLITEFLTNNNSGILDEDMTLQDWIEIHNPDPTVVDLGGYHLTDDATVPTKWTFPAGFTIPAGGYGIVFASGKDRVAPGSPLHTNFGLSSGGEDLELYEPGGLVVLSSWKPFPVQSGDVSYGLLAPMPGAASAYFTVPTPGSLNDAAAAPADPVTFSVASRTFNQGASFPVELGTASPATIRYTLNRAVPIAEQGLTGNFTANSATDVLTMPAHGLKDRDEVQVATTSALPTGLGLGLNYYVKVLTADTLQLSLAAGGPVVDFTSNGSGTHSIRRHAAYFTAAVTGLLTTTEHRFHDRDEVEVSSTGTLPGGLAAGTPYYISLQDRNSYRLALTPGGATVSISTVGTGVHTVRRKVSPVYVDPLVVNLSQRIRARAFAPGRPDGPVRSESYLALDANAQAFTSNLPVFILHSWGSGHPSTTAPAAGVPEDTKQAVWFVFEPKPEGPNMVARLTNTPDLTVPAYFERRGSSTFDALKYSMTMGAYDESNAGLEVSPLGFASNDDFVLNAHYQFDRSLMHNDLIYRLSNEVGRYAAKTRHIEVFMSVGNDVGASGGNPAWGLVNGGTTAADYYGVYSFQDKVSRGTNRIDVENLTPEDNAPPEVQGGYVFKIDRLDAGDVGLGAAGRTFALVDPKEFTSYPSHLPVMTAPQKSYLQTTLNAMYASCTSPDFMSPTLGYAAHLDVPAAIDHHILSLAPKSADAFRLSGFWHKSREGKLVMGPIFDFDRAMGSTDGRDLNPRTWRGDTGDLGTDYFHNASIFTPNYFHWMFRDPNFWQAWIDRLEELRQGVLSTAHVHAIIDEYTELLDPGNAANTPAKRNFQKFTANPPRGASGNTPGTNGTFRGEAQWLKNWWGKAGAVTQNGRLDFMDGQFTRPALASQPSGPVPAGGMVTLDSPSLATPGVKIYYTTDGTDPRAPATMPLPTGGSGVTLATILPEINPVRAIVPTGDIGTSWRNLVFDDSGWYANAAGTINGVGYDDNLGISYLPFINLRWSTNGTVIPPNNASNRMRDTNQTCYIRWPFTLSPADAALINGTNKVFLQVRYDDAFVAWLNGTELTSAHPGNAPATGTLTWSSGATGTHDDNAALLYVDYDITAFSASFASGDNVLAIQGLNSGTGSSDFVCQVKMIVQGPPPPYEPEFTPGAMEYTAPLTIAEPTELFVRTVNPVLPSDPPTGSGGGVGSVPNGSSWSAPTRYYFFPGAVSASQASIRISEVHYHPADATPDEIGQGWADSNDFEFIRLTNTGADPVDLTGIHFSDGVTFIAEPGLQNWLPAGGSVVVVENAGAFAYRYGDTFTVLGTYNDELSNAGERIVLRDKVGDIISDFTYDDADPWPVEADRGHSLVFVSGDPNVPASWRASLDPGGTSANTYARWASRYFPDPGLHPMDGNEDGDVLNNLGEYAFGTDPGVAGGAENAVVSLVVGDPSLFGMRRRIGATDVTYYFETSASLLSGEWMSPPGEPLSITDNGNGTETLVWEVPAGAEGAPLYLRARVTSP